MRTALLIAAICGVTSMASAQDIPVGTVHVADLNLSSPEGIASAKERIRSVANGMCVTAGSEVEQLTVRVARRACAQHAIADGESKLTQMLAQKQSGANLAAATLTIAAH